MAKVKSPPKPKGKAPIEIVVNYDLFDLPTAFHKAGLAGLVLLIESLKVRHVLTEGEAKYEMTSTCVTVTFTDVLIQKLMDDVYDAKVVEVSVKSKWPGADLKREETVEEEVDGKKLKSKRYIYDQVQPKGSFFNNVFDGEKEIWRKLWRDMLWNITRGRPTTRIPFNERADRKPCGEGEATWTNLLKVEKARGNNGFHIAELSSALFPGAQAVNAEGIAFEGRAEENLLLHFWTLVVLVYVPNVVEADGSSDFVGYTLAVPEVSDLVDFVEEYPKILSGFKSTVRGYRPAEAVIDIAAEGGLSFLNHLAELAEEKAKDTTLRYSIRSVEYLHLVKAGNNIKTMAAGRVSPNPKLLSGYRAIVSPKPGVEPSFRNPLFRRGLLIALLEGDEWFRPFGKTFAGFEVVLFIRQSRKSDDAEQKGPPQFATDSAKMFQYESQQFINTLERFKTMPEADRPKLNAPLPVIVNRVVRNYVLTRTQEKTGIDPDKYKTPEGETDYKALPGEFNETKQKLALGLMLEFRSRKYQAFIDHFAATFFSVTQRLAESDRLLLADSLLREDRQEALKTLTLMSLSANS